MIEDRISYRQQTMSLGEKPLWESYLVRGSSFDPEKYRNREISLASVSEFNYISQYDDTSFKEFQDPRNQAIAGVSDQEMRDSGCGISCLWMSMSSVVPEFNQNYMSVGELAIEALSHHRNDLKEPFVKGTPVYSGRAGWYHDALGYTALNITKKLGRDLKFYRLENLSGLEEVVSSVQSDLDSNRKVSVIASVDNSFWPLHSHAFEGTHLVIFSGFRFDEQGKVSEVRVTDPHPNREESVSKNELWIHVNDDFRKSFKGRAMVLSSKN